MTREDMMAYYPMVVAVEDECELTILRNEVVARYIFEGDNSFSAEYNKFIDYLDKRLKLFKLLHKEHIHIML
jgi:hypothetical protein